MSRLEEDQVLAQLTQNATSGFCVDIGASDGITWSNTYPLLQRGWQGVAMECDKDKVPILLDRYAQLNCSVITDKITPLNIAQFIANAPSDFDVLSLDIDGYDYFVLEALLKTHRPRHIVLEINQCVPPPYKFAVLFNPDYWWGVDTFYGQSIAAAHELLTPFGYKLHRVVFDNAIFSLDGIGLELKNAWVDGFLERKDGDVFPNFGQEVSRQIGESPLNLDLIRNLWPARESEFRVWI